MEERKLIEPLASDDRRRPYQITAAGSQVLAESVDQMRELARVGEARLKSVRTPCPRFGVMSAEEPGATDSNTGPGANDRRLRWYPDRGELDTGTSSAPCSTTSTTGIRRLGSVSVL